MSGHLSLGIDIGTTNVKACLLDTSSGKVIASASAEHPLYHPYPGRAEQDPDDYWRAVRNCIASCVEQYPGNSVDVAGVSISGLVGVTLPVDRDGRPLRRAMIWMDSRSRQECDDIRASVGEDRIKTVNGNRVASWFVEPKALWLKRHEPEVFAAIHKLLSPTGYCAMRLSGQYTVNHGDAGLFYPYDYRRGRWDHSLTESLSLSPDIYPDIYSSDTVIGTVTPQAARETGLTEGTAVVAGGTDIGAAALGAGAVETGQAYYSMGTGSNLGVLIPREQPVEEYRILKWPHVLDGTMLFDAPMAFTGASLKWFRDKFADPESALAERMGRNVFDLVTAQADQVSAGADGLMYLPYLGNSLAPRWDGQACGVFFGVQPFTSRAHVIRALIEGVAFDLYSNVRVAESAGVDFSELVLNGGPTKSTLWNQITANVTNRRLLIPDVDEAAPLGDAVIAASGTGLYKDMYTPMKELAPIRGIVDPDPDLHQMYSEFFELWSQLYGDLKKSMERHHALVNRYGWPQPSKMSGAGGSH